MGDVLMMVVKLFMLVALRTSLSLPFVTADPSSDRNVGSSFDFKELQPAFINTSTAAFEWRTSEWGACKHRDRTSCCECYRRRNISCVFRETWEQVPPFYCRKLLPVAPHNREKCAPCRQDCVMSLWGPWSDCSSTCSPATRHRTRAVLLPPAQGGRGCGPLLESKVCDGDMVPCSVEDPRPQYKWVIKPWTSCRRLNGSQSCGQGVRSRQVQCVNKNNNVVSPLFCQHHMTELSPPDAEPCNLPCDCKFSHWSPWGPCSVTCHHGNRHHGSHQGYQVRTRTMKHAESNGGLGCPALKETRICRGDSRPRCPTYDWDLGPWDKCAMDGASDVTSCGLGHQRRNVTCVRQGDPGRSEVDDFLCMQDLSAGSSGGNSTRNRLVKPAESQPCKVPCPQDCQLGEWENWSACTHSCGTGGVRVRQKPMLLPAVRGGKECEERFERKSCDPVPCNWWHVGQWTRCFLTTFDKDACGAGSQVRNVYCLNALDEVLPDELCTESAKPPTQQSCRVPCARECVVSDWSTWAHCSTTCGVQGGVQERRRRIISESLTDSPCLSEDELKQRRICNQRPCRKYLWQVSPWLPCVRMTNASAPCGDGSGEQQRAVHCEMDPGYTVNETLCNPADKPDELRTCSAPCPRDCKVGKWSRWSTCSHTCGRHSFKVRTRRVLSLALHGGTACPPQANQQGVIVQKKRCKRVPACHEYHWDVTRWTGCIMPAACGHGVQARNVTCGRNDGKRVNDELCHELSPGLAPIREQRCFQPCPGDCELSDWSKFSSCSQSCGNVPGTQTRTRHILRLDPSLEAMVQCPHIHHVDMVETQPCGATTCPVFSWVMGDWGSCIVHKTHYNDVEHACGEGVRRRHVLCERDDGVQVPHHHCDAVAMTPEKHQPCHISCTQDCRLSPWSPWTECSQACGTGTKTRSRRVLQESVNGGRLCLHLAENATCTVRDCRDFEWHVSEWRPCRPDYNFPCGRGQQSRLVGCPAGDQYDDDCEEQSPRPPTKVSCDVPCLGDCVMSEWTPWSECRCGQPNATRGRHREVLQEPLPSALQCGPLTATEPCHCATYRLELGEWTSCLIKAGEGNLCGKGYRERSVNCIRDDNVTVSLSYCPPTDDVTSEQTCDVSCPVDCKLTSYTPWSHCSAECGLEAHKMRLRSVVTMANEWGRQCPPMADLLQNTTCHTTSCYVYSWRRSGWGPCTIDARGCGVGTQSRDVECLRSDGMVVDDGSCLEEDSRSETLSDLDPYDRSRLDLQTEQTCGLPCPGDCVVSTWSRYGPCFKDCAAPDAVSSQVRTRVVLRAATGGRSCPSHLMEVRPCRWDDVLCPNFYWHAGEWGSNGRRRVHCLANDHLEVSGGCVPEGRPSPTRQCKRPCGEYARCVDGSCTCVQGFTGDGFLCLPEYGCEDNSHCVVNATYCELLNKQCLCQGGQLPDEAMQCPLVVYGESEGLEAGLSTLVLYIIIGTVCALVVLTLLCTLCLISKKKKDPPPMDTFPNLTKIDNLDTIHKSNKMKAADRSSHNNQNNNKYSNTTGVGKARYHANIMAYGDGDRKKKEGSPLCFSGPKKGMCLLDVDDDLFGSHSDSSTKPLVDDPDYVPMFGPGPHGNGSASSSLSSASPSPAYGPSTRSRREISPGPSDPLSPRLSTFFKPDAPPLPPPNHSGPRRFPTSPHTSSSSDDATSRQPRHVQADDHRGTYDNSPASSRTLPRSFQRSGSAEDPWLPQQQTMPRPQKKVWFPQEGDKKPEPIQNRSNERLVRGEQQQERPVLDREPQGATLHGPQSVKEKPPLKPKPKVLKGTHHHQVSPAGGSPAGPKKILRPANGLVYPQPPSKISETDGKVGGRTNLMEYCDELLAELETMAKT